MVLTTALEAKKTPNAPSRTPAKPHASVNEPKVPGTDTLEKWRTVKKGETVEKYGKIWTWCPKHRSEKYGYDGLY